MGFDTGSVVRYHTGVVGIVVAGPQQVDVYGENLVIFNGVLMSISDHEITAHLVTWEATYDGELFTVDHGPNYMGYYQLTRWIGRWNTIHVHTSDPALHIIP